MAKQSDSVIANPGAPLQRADIVPEAREPLRDVEPEGWGSFGPAQRTNDTDEDQGLMEVIDVAAHRTRQVDLKEGDQVNPLPPSRELDPLSWDVRVDPEP